MAAASVDAGSDLQNAIQAAVQPKLMENGWVVEENDTTLSEYVTMMIVNGKDVAGVKSELGGDLLGVGEDDAGVGEFAEWLFNTVQSLSVPPPQQQQQQQQERMTAAPRQEEQLQQIPSTQDAQMEDSTASADAPPTGPRSMRNGNAERGRGNRMLRQMNSSLGRSNELPDKLSRIKGASGVGAGRIDSHRGRDSAPRGPRNSSVASGVQRMMNGGRGGQQNSMNNNNLMSGSANAQQQMQFMQMMEMQANMVAQLLQQQNGGPAQNGRGGFAQRGTRGGRGRGGPRGGGNAPSALHAVDGKMPDGALPSGPGGSGMDIDGGAGHSNDMFSTMCKFNKTCNIPTCAFAHQSPAVTSKISVDLTDTCSHGIACTNTKCTARHPSPALRNQHHAVGRVAEVDCRFYPNCTNPSCPFRHPTRPCRNGADCTTSGCTFAHAAIMCRYNPCNNATCTFKHKEGQKQGKFSDKVWTANGSDKTDRFADLTTHNEGEEELIRPDQQQAAPQESAAPESQMETQITA